MCFLFSQRCLSSVAITVLRLSGSQIIFAEFCKEQLQYTINLVFQNFFKFLTNLLSVLHLLNCFTHVPVDLAVFVFTFFALRHSRSCKLACAKDGWGSPIEGMGAARAGCVVSPSSGRSQIASSLASLVSSMTSSIVSSL